VPPCRGLARVALDRRIVARHVERARERAMHRARSLPSTKRGLVAVPDEQAPDRRRRRAPSTVGRRSCSR
jgi:hypothetical protein